MIDCLRYLSTAIVVVVDADTLFQKKKFFFCSKHQTLTIMILTLLCVFLCFFVFQTWLNTFLFWLRERERERKKWLSLEFHQCLYGAKMLMMLIRIIFFSFLSFDFAIKDVVEFFFLYFYFCLMKKIDVINDFYYSIFHSIDWIIIIHEKFPISSDYFFFLQLNSEFIVVCSSSSWMFDIVFCSCISDLSNKCRMWYQE